MQPQLSVSGALGLRAPHPPLLGQQFSIQCGILPSPGTSRQEEEGNTCSTLSLLTGPVSPIPWGKSQQGGRQGPRSWDSPGDAQNGSGQYLEPARVQVEVAWEGPGEPRDPSPAQSSPFLLSCPCPRGHNSPWPQGGLLGLGFPAKTGAKLPWFVRLHSLPKAVSVLCVSCMAGWIQRSWKCLPKRSRAGAVHPCPSAAGGHQQLLSLAWSSSTRRSQPPRVDKPPRDAAAHSTHPLPQGAWEWHCLEQP